MSQRKSILIVLSLIMVTMMACSFTSSIANHQTVRGDGNLQTENREVANFSQVSLSGMGDLNITQGNEEKLTIEAEENLLPYITTEVRGSELRIGFKENTNVIPTKSIHFNLSLKNLNDLNISGTSNVQASSLQTDALRLSVSGTGKIDLKGLNTKDLRVNSSGAGTFTLAGNADKQDINISGTGSYTAGDLKSSSTAITVSGAGNSTLWVTESLDVHIAGLGKVSYYGKPHVTQNISGAGSVDGLGDHE